MYDNMRTLNNFCNFFIEKTRLYSRSISPRVHTSVNSRRTFVIFFTSSSMYLFIFNFYS